MNNFLEDEMLTHLTRKQFLDENDEPLDGDGHEQGYATDSFYAMCECCGMFANCDTCDGIHRESGNILEYDICQTCQYEIEYGEE